MSIIGFAVLRVERPGLHDEALLDQSRKIEDHVAQAYAGRCGREEYMHYLLMYEFVDDYLERRGAFRDEHLGLAWEAHARGELVLGGALADPVDGAILLFQGEAAAAERFVAADPYVRHGLVTRWRVRPWTTVVGTGATTPVHPAGG